MAVTLGLVVLLLLVGQSLTAVQDTKPFKNYPGAILKTTDYAEIEEALQDLDNVPNRLIYTKTLSIGFSLLGGAKLEKPRHKLKDGVSWSTLGHTLNPGETGLQLYTKYYLGIKGVYGVVTYDIAGTQLMAAVMFSVPFDQLLRGNYFNFKIFSKSTSVDSSMVDHMFKLAGAWKAGGYEEKEEYGIKITGTMSDSSRSHLIVQVDTSGYDLLKPAHRHAECSFRASALGDRCWRECNPVGWCWTKISCNKNSDCDGSKLFCDDSCNGVYD